MSVLKHTGIIVLLLLIFQIILVLMDQFILPISYNLVQLGSGMIIGGMFGYFIIKEDYHDRS